MATFTTSSLQSQAEAQPSAAQLITLYAHSAGNTTILNASPPTGPAKYSDARKRITFDLSPVLGESAHIDGSLIYTLLLNATVPSSGIISVWLSELQLTGQTIVIPGTNSSDNVFLDNQTQNYVVGTNAPIDYEFLPGSAIQLNIVVSMHTLTIPYLVWDLPTSLSTRLHPTSMKIPLLNPTQTKFDIQTMQPRYGMNGTILQANTDCNCTKAEISATVTDTIGVYRLIGSLIVTAPNGTAKQVVGLATSDYSLTYSYNASLTQGAWSFSPSLLDLDGNSYSWKIELWIALFYEVSFQVADESNESLQNAALRITDTIGQGAIWNATTDSAGHADLLLPSSDIVGPLNLTVSWLSGSFSEEQNASGAISLFVRVPVYDFAVKPLMADFVPLPNTDVVLQSGNRTIAANATGLRDRTFQRF